MNYLRIKRSLLRRLTWLAEFLSFRLILRYLLNTIKKFWMGRSILYLFIFFVLDNFGLFTIKAAKIKWISNKFDRIACVGWELQRLNHINKFYCDANQKVTKRNQMTQIRKLSHPLTLNFVPTNSEATAVSAWTRSIWFFVVFIIFQRFIFVFMWYDFSCFCRKRFDHRHLSLSPTRAICVSNNVCKKTSIFHLIVIKIVRFIRQLPNSHGRMFACAH